MIDESSVYRHFAIVRSCSIWQIIRFCSANGGIGTKNCSKLFAARLGCAVPLSNFLISSKNKGESKNIIMNSDRICSLYIDLKITKEDAIAPLSKGNFPCFPKDPLMHTTTSSLINLPLPSLSYCASDKQSKLSSLTTDFPSS